MLRNADYIYNNILIADGTNSTLDYCKKAQVGVDMSVKNFKAFITPGTILTDKSYVSETDIINKIKWMDVKANREVKGWFLDKGTYILELNEGCQFGKNDTGYVILRSSFNRSGCTVVSAVWDPGFTTRDGDVVNTMSVRFTVDTPRGIYIEENARIAQLVVAENEDADLYNGQFQGGQNVSRLV